MLPEKVVISEKIHLLCNHEEGSAGRINEEGSAGWISEEGSAGRIKSFGGP